MYPVGREYHFLYCRQSWISVIKLRKIIPWHIHKHKRSNNPSKKRSKRSKWYVYRSMRSRSAWIMVVCNQTLMSSWVMNRDISVSWLELRTAKIGNSSSCKTVSQNSAGKSRPRVFRVENNESKALCNRESRAIRKNKVLTLVWPPDLPRSWWYRKTQIEPETKNVSCYHPCWRWMRYS